MLQWLIDQMGQIQMEATWIHATAIHADVLSRHHLTVGPAVVPLPLRWRGSPVHSGTARHSEIPTACDKASRAS
jgi:hypothetical protein